MYNNTLIIFMKQPSIHENRRVKEALEVCQSFLSGYVFYLFVCLFFCLLVSVSRVWRSDSQIYNISQLIGLQSGSLFISLFTQEGIIKIYFYPGVTIMLAITIFSSIVGDMLPVTDTTPLIGQCICLVCKQIICRLICNFFFFYFRDLLHIFPGFP